MIEYKMKLTDEERAILEDEKGETLRKAMESVVLFGDTFGAERLVPLDGPIHMVFAGTSIILKPYLDMVDEIVDSGLTAMSGFTADPRSVDRANMEYTEKQESVLQLLFPDEKKYEEQLLKAGLKDKNAFTCTCYLDEVGNIPDKGDILVWAESSAVVYANSVLGARTNRNSGGIEFLCGVLGKTPLFGLLTDEGRRARWLIEVKTSQLPEATVLGSAIGMKVNEDVPYIVGLDRFLGTHLNGEVKDYCKDMGAAAAANGAVGLYHIENLTPEALETGRDLLAQGYRSYVVDDTVIEEVVASYPVVWKNPEADPELCFIGCPHLSSRQVYGWLEKIEDALEKEGRKTVELKTWLVAAPDVIEAFRRDEPAWRRLQATGVGLTALCPLNYMQNPVLKSPAAITNSNKLRTYTSARYLTDEKTVQTIVTGKPHYEKTIQR
ncbi:MAG: DUF521 domain-containing protein [Proteobacteria bacterium]|nr:DUF521 domain-containing protein [Pseudomonadota bacterium]